MESEIEDTHLVDDTKKFLKVNRAKYIICILKILLDLVVR